MAASDVTSMIEDQSTEHETSGEHHLFSFQQLSAIVHEGVNVTSLLASAKAELLSLKEGWILADSKNRFLNEVVKDNVLDVCTDDCLQKLNETRSAALELDEARAQLKARTKEVREVVAELAERYAQFEKEKATFAELVMRRQSEAAELVHLVVEATQRNASTPAFGQVDARFLSMDSESKCRAIIDAQLETMKQLVQETGHIQAEIVDIELETAPLMQQVMAMSSEIGQAMASRAASFAEAQDDASDGVDPDTKKWTMLAQLTSSLTGVDVQYGQPDDNVVTITFLGTPYTLTVRFDPSGSRFHEIELRPAGLAVDDVVSYARLVQDFEFLTREIGVRARSAVVRDAALRKDLEPYPLSQWVKGSSDVTVVIDNDQGLVCEVYIGPEYPSPMAQLTVVSVSGACGWAAEDLKRIASEANEANVRSLPALLQLVKQLLYDQIRVYEQA